MTESHLSLGLLQKSSNLSPCFLYFPAIFLSISPSSNPIHSSPCTITEALKTKIYVTLLSFSLAPGESLKPLASLFFFFLILSCMTHAYLSSLNSHFPLQPPHPPMFLLLHSSLFLVQLTLEQHSFELRGSTFM